MIEVPLSYIRQVFDVMRRASWHRFQVLTKRSERLAELSSRLEWTPNLWMGVSVENDKYRFRIDNLRSTGAHVKFLSLEPLLGPLTALNLFGIDWVIVGGESSPRARADGSPPSACHAPRPSLPRVCSYSLHYALPVAGVALMLSLMFPKGHARLVRKQV